MTRLYFGLLYTFFSFNLMTATAAPIQPCDGVPLKKCTPFMEKVFENFLHAENLTAHVEEAVYNGECQYLSIDYAPDTVHYTGLYLAYENDKPHFNAAFSFFASPNPYTGWTLDSVKEEFSSPLRYPMTSYENYSTANYMPSGGVWRFWLSQDPETLDIFLISYWGIHTRGFCHYSKNPTQ